MAGLLTGSLLACPAASAGGGALGLADAQGLAVARSRQIAGMDAAAAAARDRSISAAQLPDPVLKAGIDNLPVTGSDRYRVGSDFMTMRRVGIAQDLPRSGKRQLNAQKFEREADRYVAERDAATALVERNTALAWLERYFAEAAVSLIRDERDAAELEIQAAQAAYRAGRVSQADVLAARSARALLDDRVSEAEQRVQSARIALSRWTGTAVDGALAAPPDRSTVRLRLDAIEADLDRHPDIVALTRQVEVADVEARLALANRQADWGVEVSIAERGPQFSNMVSVGLTIPLQWNQGRRQDRDVAARLAEVDQARSERDEMLRQHVAETRAIVVQWESGLRRQLRYRDELVPLAGERIQAALAAYRSGRSTLGEVIAARRAEVDVRLQALQLDAETSRLWAQLNFLHPLDNEAHHARDDRAGLANAAGEP